MKHYTISKNEFTSRVGTTDIYWGCPWPKYDERDEAVENEATKFSQIQDCQWEHLNIKIRNDWPEKEDQQVEGPSHGLDWFGEN